MMVIRECSPPSSELNLSLQICYSCKSHVLPLTPRYCDSHTGLGGFSGAVLLVSLPHCNVNQFQNPLRLSLLARNVYLDNHICLLDLPK